MSMSSRSKTKDNSVPVIPPGHDTTSSSINEGVESSELTLLISSLIRRELERLTVKTDEESKDRKMNLSNSIPIPNPFGLGQSENSLIGASLSSSSNTPLAPNPVDSSRNFELPDSSKYKLMKDEETSVLPEMFITWNVKVQSALNARIIYRKLLFKPEDSWRHFIEDNSKYESSQLESFYLDAHRKLWDFLTGCISSGIKSEIEEAFQADSTKYNLSLSLNFRKSDPDFYQDCHSLMEEFIERFQRKTIWNLNRLLEEHFTLIYDGKSDPIIYFNKYRTILNKIKKLHPNYKIQEDRFLAAEILCKLPKVCKNLKDKYLSQKDPPTIDELRSHMVSWWDSQRTGHKINPNTERQHSEHTNATVQEGNPNGNKKKKFKNKGKGNSNNNNNGPRNHSQSSSRDEKEHATFPVFEDNALPDEVNATLNNGTFIQYNPQRNHLLFDTGATCHIAADSSLLQDVKKVPEIFVNTICGKKTINTVGTWHVTPEVTMTNVRVLPNAPFSLLSIANATNNGYSALFTADGAYVFKSTHFNHLEKDFQSKVRISAKRMGNLWVHNIDGQRAKHDVYGKDFISVPRGKDVQTAKLNPVDEQRLEDSKLKSIPKQGSIPKPQGTGIPKKKPLASSEVKDTVSQQANAVVDESPCMYEYINSIVELNEINPSQVVLDDSDSESDIESVHEESVITHSDSVVQVKSSTTLEDSKPIQPKFNSESLDESPLRKVQEWHQRLGHVGIKQLTNTNLKYDLGLSKHSLSSFEDCDCDVCLQSKARRVVIGAASSDPNRIAKGIMECWHIDLIGPFSRVEEGKRVRLHSVEGFTYILVMVDEYSRYTFTCSLVDKSEAVDSLVYMIKLKQNETRLNLARIHCDGGKEFVNTKLKSFLQQNGTELSLSVAYTPRLNGIVERRNQELTAMSRSMLHHSNSPAELFPHAYFHATHILNQIAPSSSKKEIPSTLFGRVDDKRNPTFNLNKLHTFGCDSFAFIEEKDRGKMDSKSIPCIYLGYSSQYDAHKLLLINESLQSFSIKVARNVSFKENSFDLMKQLRSSWSKFKLEQRSSRLMSVFDLDYIGGEFEHEGETYFQVFWRGLDSPSWESKSFLQKFHLDSLSQFQLWKQNKSDDLVMSIQSDWINLTSDSLNEYCIPQSFKQAMLHIDRDQWIKSIQLELDSLRERKVFKLCQLPVRRKAIDCRWVFAIKRDSNNQIIKHKARLVVKGFRQKEGIDYNETFAPTVRMKSIKLILAIAAIQDFEIKQLDFDTAFLNAGLDEEIYVKIPEGYQIKEGIPSPKFGVNNVLKLEKALYGLKQAPRQWWLELTGTLNGLGYYSSPLDEGLYIKTIQVEGKEYSLFLLLYVDDTIIIYPKIVEKVWISDKSSIEKKYKIKDLGDCEWILNMLLIRDRNLKSISLSQEGYINLILGEFDMLDCKSDVTPFLYPDLSVPPPKIECYELDSKETKLYQSIVGSLMYAANITRVDIAYITHALARYCNKPMNYHLAAAKKVLRYLKGSSNLKMIFQSRIKFDPNVPFRITIFSDSNWAMDKDDRKSTGGYVVLINGCPISWQSKKHSTVALSSTEAEYYSLTDAVTEGMFLRQWFKYYLKVDLTINIYCDNQGAMHIADHSTNHNRTKHIDIKHFYVRQHVKDKKVVISFVPTTDQLADILTKPVKKIIFQRLVKLLLS